MHDNSLWIWWIPTSPDRRIWWPNLGTNLHPSPCNHQLIITSLPGEGGRDRERRRRRRRRERKRERGKGDQAARQLVRGAISHLREGERGENSERKPQWPLCPLTLLISPFIQVGISHNHNVCSSSFIIFCLSLLKFATGSGELPPITKLTRKRKHVEWDNQDPGNTVTTAKKQCVTKAPQRKAPTRGGVRGIEGVWQEMERER